MYLCVSVGNSDDRLTQKEWNSFVRDISLLLQISGEVHFFGGASTWEPWQNAAWIVDLKDAPISVMARISEIRERYKQDSAFVLFGEGQFI